MALMNKQPKNKKQPLMRVQDHPRLADLRARLAEAEPKLPAAQARLDNAKRRMDEAEEEKDRTERMVLAGRATDADLDVAQTAYQERKREYAQAEWAHKDVANLVANLPGAILLVEQEAKIEVAAYLRAAYGEALLALKQALLAAQETSDVVHTLHGEALRELGSPFGEPHDCGDVMIPNAAGLGPSMAWSQLSRTFDVHNNVLLDNWLRDADKLLAKLPTMAEADRELKVSHDTHERRMKQERAEQAAKEAERAQRNLDRFGEPTF